MLVATFLLIFFFFWGGGVKPSDLPSSLFVVVFFFFCIICEGLRFFFGSLSLGVFPLLFWMVPLLMYFSSSLCPLFFSTLL